MKLTMLGTGNALVTKCYNTCFVLTDETREVPSRHVLVDAGGGNTVLQQLERAGIDWHDIHEIFVTHKHIDHILGIVWMMRLICQHMKKGSYEGEATIYAHDEVIEILQNMASALLQPSQTAFIGERLHLVCVEDGETRELMGHPTTFFDIRSTKAKQYGFAMELGEGRRLVCCGDEPYNECERVYAEGATWLLHEAFCLYAQADVFSPYEKHHSTAKDAAELAERLRVENLVLYHTEDKSLDRRRALYTEEAKQYFSGNVFVPDDLEVIEL